MKYNTYCKKGILNRILVLGGLIYCCMSFKRELDIEDVVVKNSGRYCFHTQFYDLEIYKKEKEVMPHE